MRLYMIRHGQTYANRDQYYYGKEEVALTDLGEAQARSTRSGLSTNHQGIRTLNAPAPSTAPRNQDYL